MRSPKLYVAKNGDVSWKVRYRSATGQQKSETFYDEKLAVEFCKVLEALGPARAIVWLDEQEGSDARDMVTVGDLWAAWYEWKSAARKDGTLLRVRSSRTLEDYRRMWHRHIEPEFAAQPADMVGPREVQDWVDALQRQLAAKTVCDYHSLLHAMYAWGLHPTRGLVVNDPCQETQLPKRRKKPPKGLLPNEWAILYQAALNVDQDAADLLLFLAATGWRWSEAVAVQALAVDHWTEAGESHTYVTMGRVLRREGRGHVFVEDEAKSDAGRRRVRVMGAAEVMVLRRVYGKGPTDLLFTKGNGGAWGYSYFYQLVWCRPKGKRGKAAPNKPRILEEATRLGLVKPGLTPHWLRHTHVGMLIRAGEPLTAIQRRLGHASIKTTSDTYGRMIEDASSEGLARAAAMLGGTVPAGAIEPGQAMASSSEAGESDAS